MNIPREIFMYEILDYVPLGDILQTQVVPIQHLLGRRSKMELLELISQNPSDEFIDIYLERYPKWELLEYLILNHNVDKIEHLDMLLEDIDQLPIQLWSSTSDIDRLMDLLEAMLEQDLLTEDTLVELEDVFGVEFGDPEFRDVLGLSPQQYKRYKNIVADFISSLVPTFM